MSVALVRGYTRHLRSPSPGVSTDPLDRGLVLDLRLDPATGRMLPNYSGRKGNLTIYNSASWESTLAGVGLRLHSVTSDYASAVLPYLPLGAEPFTIEVYMLGYNTGGSFTFWGTESANNANGFRFDTTNAKIRHYFWGNDLVLNVGIPGYFSDGRAHQVVVTYDGTDRVIIVDGGKHTASNSPGAATVAGTTFYVGRRPGGSYANFTFLDLRIYNRALTAGEAYQRSDLCFARATLRGSPSLWYMPWGKVAVAAGLAMPIISDRGVHSTVLGGQIVR